MHRGTTRASMSSSSLMAAVMRSNCSSSRQTMPPLLLPLGRRRRRYQRQQQRQSAPPTNAIPPDALAHLSDLASHAAVLAYERVVLPCQAAGCGDIVYRSTLDPVLRMETRTVSPQVFAIAAALLAYLCVRPGVAAGAIDFYILDRASRALRRRVGPSDVVVGDKMAQGGFGSVYRATLLGENEAEKERERRRSSGGKASSSSSSSSSPSSSSNGVGGGRPVILKIATEFGPAEAWMNERLSRAAPWAVASFITAFDEVDPNLDDDDGDDDFVDDDTSNKNIKNKNKKKKQKKQKKSAAEGGPLWLLWEDEGPDTASLSQLMKRRDWPYCAEQLLFGRELRLPKGARRRGAVIKEVARQLLQALDALHAVGIVHRDVKPQNVIVSQRDRRVKLIDLGAAADLRVGVNYSPNALLLDPRYAPPEKYVMSRLTAEAPPAALAFALSPVLWRLERPDRFDSYAVGITLLQLCFPGLRTDDAVVAFQKKLQQQCGGDLDRWATETGARSAREYAEGFEFLDADGGAGWELLCQLTARAQRSRPAAGDALRSRWLKRKKSAGVGGIAGAGSAGAAAPPSKGGLASFFGGGGRRGDDDDSVAAPLAPLTEALSKAGGAAAARLGESLESVAAAAGELSDGDFFSSLDGAVDRGGGLSEAYLSEEFNEEYSSTSSSDADAFDAFFADDNYGGGKKNDDGDGKKKKKKGVNNGDSSDDDGGGEDGDGFYSGGKTMAWWRGRQAALRPLPKKKARASGSSSSGGGGGGGGSGGVGNNKAKKRAEASAASAAAAAASSSPSPSSRIAVTPPESSQGILNNLKLPWSRGGGGEKGEDE